MKGIIKYSIAVITITLAILSCNKQIDYGPDINLIKGQITSINARLDSLTSAIKIVTSQLTNIQTTLKATIDNTNNRVDSISTAFATLKTQVNTNTSNIAATTKSITDITSSINGLTTDIKTINTSLTKTNTDLKKKTDSILLSIDSSFKIIKVIDSTLKKTGFNTDTLSAKTLVLNSSYNDILSKYLELLKIVKTTTQIIEINGVEDRSEISKFIDQMPIADSKYIRKFMDDNEPRLDLTRTVIAPSGEKLTVNVGFGVDFFRPFF